MWAYRSRFRAGAPENFQVFSNFFIALFLGIHYGNQSVFLEELLSCLFDCSRTAFCLSCAGTVGTVVPLALAILVLIQVSSHECFCHSFSSAFGGWLDASWESKEPWTWTTIEGSVIEHPWVPALYNEHISPGSCSILRVHSPIWLHIVYTIPLSSRSISGHLSRFCTPPGFLLLKLLWAGRWNHSGRQALAGSFLGKDETPLADLVRHAFKKYNWL